MDEKDEVMPETDGEVVKPVTEGGEPVEGEVMPEGGTEEMEVTPEA